MTANTEKARQSTLTQLIHRVHAPFLCSLEKCRNLLESGTRGTLRTAALLEEAASVKGGRKINRCSKEEGVSAGGHDGVEQPDRRHSFVCYSRFRRCHVLAPPVRRRMEEGFSPGLPYFSCFPSAGGSPAEHSDTIPQCCVTRTFGKTRWGLICHDLKCGDSSGCGCLWVISGPVSVAVSHFLPLHWE